MVLVLPGCEPAAKGAGLVDGLEPFGELWLILQGGSVAQITKDSLRDSKVLVGLHEQTHTPDLPHDELAFLSSH